MGGPKLGKTATKLQIFWRKLLVLFNMKVKYCNNDQETLFKIKLVYLNSKNWIWTFEVSEECLDLTISSGMLMSICMLSSLSPSRYTLSINSSP